MKKESILQIIICLILIALTSFIIGMKSETTFLTFLDTFTLMSFIITGLGVFNRMRLKGDIDLLGYSAKRSVNIVNREAVYNDTYADYKAEMARKHEGKVNIPLYTGLIGIVLSLLISLFY